MFTLSLPVMEMLEVCICSARGVLDYAGEKGHRGDHALAPDGPHTWAGMASTEGAETHTLKGPVGVRWRSQTARPCSQPTTALSPSPHLKKKKMVRAMHPFEKLWWKCKCIK